MILKLLSSRYPGMRWWLSQRLTAIVMAIYLLIMVVTLLIVQPESYLAWQSFAQSLLFKLSTLLFFAAFCIHAWLGVRDVLRDYIFNRAVRAVLQWGVNLLIVFYMVWLLVIMWNV